MTSPGKSIWRDPAVLDHLHELVADPRKLSTEDIALELSVRHRMPVSRNSVISKCARLGLRLPLALSSEERRVGYRVSQPSRARISVKSSKRRKRTGFSMPAPTPDWDAGNPGTRIVRAAEFRRQAKGEAMQTEQLPPVGQRRTFTELSDAHCKYIFGDPKQGQDAYFFCGDQAIEGRSWCLHHDMIVRPDAYLVDEPFLQAAE